MRRVFILGAGASHFAGYPLGLKLWPFIRENQTREINSKRSADEVVEAIERLLEIQPPAEIDRPDLEQLFTLLDLSRHGTDLLGIEELHWKDIRAKLMDMIAKAFQKHEYDVQDEVRSGHYADVLGCWTSLIREGDTIVTFNWDLLHEAALWRAHKWHYADGYGFACRDSPADCSSKTKVLKLHGSVNWAQRDESDFIPEIEDRATFFYDAPDDANYTGSTDINDGRYLIVPSYLKDISSNRLLLRLWNQASDAIAAAEHVTVIGFQLHPADALARQLLAGALTRNPRTFAVQIVAPDSDRWGEFCYNIGRERQWIRMKFEDWVLNSSANQVSA